MSDEVCDMQGSVIDDQAPDVHAVTAPDTGEGDPMWTRPLDSVKNAYRKAL